ncbi:MAG: hypothetical protein ACTSUK_03915 [Promethearchaeota archaeon]
MTTLTKDKVLQGKIVWEREDYPRATFILKEGTDVNNGDLIEIKGKLTSSGSTSSDVIIFKGRISEKNFDKTPLIKCESEAEEMDKIIPSGSYQGYVDCIIGEIINNNCNYITCQKTDTTTIIVPNEDVSKGDWTDSGGNGILHDDVDEGETPNDNDYIETNKSTTCNLGFQDDQLTTSSNHAVYKVDVVVRVKGDYELGGYTRCSIEFFDGTEWKEEESIYDAIEDGIDWKTVTTTYTLNLTQDEVNDFRLRIKSHVSSENVKVYVSNVYIKVYHYYFPNLQKSSKKVSQFSLQGEKTLRKVFDWASAQILGTWYLTPSNEFKLDDSTTDSGVVFDNNNGNIWNVKGKQLTKNYDKVILYGGFSGTSRLTSTYGTGNIIYKDTISHITNQSDLDDLAEEIYNRQYNNPLTISFDYKWDDKGIIQVGEEITIKGNTIKFDNSGDYICSSDTNFKIRKEEIIIKNGKIINARIIADDGIVIEDEIIIEEEKKFDLSKENSELISQVSNLTGSGEANTGQNVGTSGVGVYKGKSGVTLQFKKINAGSNKISITDDTSNDEVDIDVNVGNIDHGSLSGLNDDDHNQYLLINGSRSMTGDLDLDDHDLKNCIDHLSGSTYSDLQDWFDIVESGAVISGGDITDNGDGTVAVASGTGIIKSSDTSVAPAMFFNWSPVSSLSLTNNSMNYIYIDYNGGSPQVKATTSKSSINDRTEVVIGRVYREGTTLHIMNAYATTTEISLKTHKRLVDVFGFQRYEGMKLSETGTRNIAITAGGFYYGLNSYSTSAFDSSGTDTFIYLYRDGSGGWNKNTGETQIDNIHYDDGSGTLATLTSNRYGVHWVYMLEDGAVYVIYGRGNYTLANAKAATAPSDTPDYISEIGILIGKIIIQKNASSFTEIIQPREEIEFTIPTDHGELSGLGDDDHTQYLLVDGSRAMTGNLDLQDNTLIVGDSSDTSDPINLIKFETERSWFFRKRSTGAATYLSLESEVNGKTFNIGYGDGSAWAAKFVVSETQANNRVNLYKLQINSGITIDAIKDEDNMASNSASALATQQSIKAYVDNNIITDHGSLNGLGDDDHTQYLLVNGTRAMTGDLSLGGHNIINVGNSGSDTALKLRAGDDGNQSYGGVQIRMGYNGTDNYSHNIRTTHHSGQDEDNSMLFYLWDYGTDNAGDPGSKLIMKLDAEPRINLYGTLDMGGNSIADCGSVYLNDYTQLQVGTATQGYYATLSGNGLGFHRTSSSYIDQIAGGTIALRIDAVKKLEIFDSEIECLTNLDMKGNDINNAGIINVGDYTGNEEINIKAKGDGDSHLFFQEESANYGIRLVYDGGDNKLYFKRHDNDANGVNVMAIDRVDNNVEFYGNIDLSTNDIIGVDAIYLYDIVINQGNYNVGRIGARGNDYTDFNFYLVPKKADNSDWDWDSEFGFDRSSNYWYFETDLNMNSNSITNLADPVNAQDAATKKYVDDSVQSGGDNLGNHIATKDLNMFNFKIINLASPSAASDGANKSYVDAHANNTSNPHNVTLDQCFDQGKIIDGANSDSNAFQVGSNNYKLKMYINEYSNVVFKHTSSTGQFRWYAGSNFLLWLDNSIKVLAPGSNNVYTLGNNSYAWKTVYAYKYVDKTKFPSSKSALSKLLKIKGDENGELLHDSLPEDLKVYDEEKKQVVGRDLSSTVSYLIKAIQELNEKIEKLELKLKNEMMEK